MVSIGPTPVPSDAEAPRLLLFSGFVLVALRATLRKGTRSFHEALASLNEPHLSSFRFAQRASVQVPQRFSLKNCNPQI